MRILHFSDVHIGVESYGHTDPATGLSTRLGDFLHTFDQLVDYAIDTGVDLALFSGDAYKSRDPSQTHQREFARRIARLSHAGIPVFLLVGNHDVPNVATRATALDIFPTLAVPNVITADRLETHVVHTRAGPLQIVALPWIRRSAYLAREETRGLSIDDINSSIQERVTNLVSHHISALDPSMPAVFTAHATLNTARAGSEQSMLLGRDPVLMQSTVARAPLDYVALGHVHRHQVLAQDPHVVYAGSLERVDFGEEHDEKGFCVIELDPTAPPGRRLVDFSFHTVDARRFLTIEVRVRADEDPTQAAIRAIERSDVADAIVRVRVTMPQEVEAQLRENEVRAALSSAHFVAPIVRDVTRERRTRLGATPVEGISPQEALRLYLETTNVPPERARTLMEMAERLISEEAERAQR